MCEAVITTPTQHSQPRTPTVGMAGTDPRADFQRAHTAHLFARATRWLTARRPTRTRPRNLGNVTALSWRTPRLRAVPLEAIVGTVDATVDFDANFRPATHRIASRWQSIARAHREGRPLQPISVLERPDGYYVLDGRPHAIRCRQAVQGARAAPRDLGRSVGGRDDHSSASGTRSSPRALSALARATRGTPVRIAARSRPA